MHPLTNIYVVVLGLCEFLFADVFCPISNNENENPEFLCEAVFTNLLVFSVALVPRFLTVTIAKLAHATKS